MRTVRGAEGSWHLPWCGDAVVVSERRKSLGLGSPFLGRGGLRNGVADGCGRAPSPSRSPRDRWQSSPGSPLPGSPCYRARIYCCLEVPLILKSMSCSSRNEVADSPDAGISAGTARNRKGEGSQDSKQSASPPAITATCHPPSSNTTTPATPTPNLDEPLQRDFSTRRACY